jgi:hypothetical protein
MPSEIHGSVSSFIQTLSRMTRSSSTGRSDRAHANQKGATNGTDHLDLTSDKDLSPKVADAVRDARGAHEKGERARGVIRRISEIRIRIRELRAAAQEAIETNTPASETEGLPEQVEAIEEELGELEAPSGGQTTGGQTTSEESPATAPTPAGAVQMTQVSITGSGAGVRGLTQENEVGLSASEIARDAGVEDVRLAGRGADAVFRFEDTGNGMVTATRYDVTEDGLVESGTQTVALRNFQSGAMVDGASETLDFGRLGLHVDLGEDYTPGDLHRVDMRVQTPDAGQEARADEPAASAPTTDGISALGPDGAAAAAAVTRQLGALAYLADRLTSEAQAAESNAMQDVTRALGDIAQIGLADLDIDTQTLERQIRAAVLGQ